MKDKKEKMLYIGFSLILTLFLFGCQPAVKSNSLQEKRGFNEAQWIINGEPIEFEGEYWYPVDGVENLLNSEVYVLGEYKGVTFYVEKIDVRPYNRLYTKFDDDHYRFFEKRKNNDKN